MTEFIDLREAAKLIRQEHAQTDGIGRTPFFFVVGAGISIPPLPLSSDVVDQCRAVAKSYDIVDEPTSSSPLQRYSFWFQKAYPSPIARQRYLRNLILDKPISEANLRLAHLLSSRTPATIVVTPNFDDFAARALTLFGVPHVVCDHSATTERIDPENVQDVQVIHVHGSYSFYDCCNLAGEIEARARSSQETSSTMAFLLDDILRARSPIVVGYSGWESDVIMSALRRRLRSSLPYNAYWFLHRRSDIASLPQWLTDHPNVFFVTGTRVHRDATQQRGDGDIPELAAKDVFDELIRTFGVEAPLLTRDPLAYLAGHLRISWYSGDRAASESDVYAIKSVIARVEAARRLEEAASASSPGTAPKFPLEAVRDAIRRSEYEEALRSALKVAYADLSQGELHELLGLLQSGTIAITNAPLEISAYDRMMDIVEKLRAEGKSQGFETERYDAVAHSLAALTLAGSEDRNRAILLADEAELRFGGVPELTLWVVNALLAKVHVYRINKDYHSAALTSDGIVNRVTHGGEISLAVRQRLAQAYVSAAASYNGAKEFATALERLRVYFADSETVACDAIQRAEAVLQKGKAAAGLGDWATAAESATKLLDEYSGDVSRAESQIVEGGLLLAEAALKIGNPDAALRGASEALRAARSSRTPWIMSFVPRAIEQRAVILETASRLAEARISWEELLAYSVSEKKPDTQALAEAALHRLGNEAQHV